MSDSAEPVTITILDRKYQFACSEEDREDLISAARALDEQMNEIKENGRLMSLERIALQVALNLSDEVIKLRRNDELRKEKIDCKIRLLADQLDEALSETS
jgi:cell division protein ZapA